MTKYNLKNKTGRAAIPVTGKGVFIPVAEGLQLGYRSYGGERPGAWLIKTYNPATGKRSEASLRVVADDKEPANGSSVLNYDQAVTLAKTKISSTTSGAIDVTVATALTEWAEHKIRSTSAEGSKAANYRSSAQRLASALGKFKLVSLKRTDLTAWRDAWAETGAAKSTINREIGNLQAALNLAVKNHWVAITGQPWSGLKFGKQVSFNTRVDTLTPEQIEALLAELRPDAKLFFQFMAATGARNGEVANLRVQDVFDNGVYSARLKGKTGSRVIPLPPKALAAVQEAMRGANDPERAVFIRQDNGTAWGQNPKLVRDLFKAAAKKLKLLDSDGKLITPYVLRHSSITRMLIKGVPVSLTAKAHGTSPTMVQQTYAHYAPNELLAAFG